MTLEERLHPLSYAVRPSVVLKYLGQLWLAVAVLSLVPLAVAAGFGDFAFAWRQALAAALFFGVGAPLVRLPKPRDIQVNEALAITALIFVTSPLVLAYPMTSAGLSYGDALFEAISGITTTGLTTLPSVADKPPGFLFARAWMQWYGGLGIVVLSVALLIGPGNAAKRLAEIGGEGDDLAGSTRAYARRVVVVYLLLTLIGIGLIWALSGAPFTAVVHTLAAVSTGGFSSLNASLEDMNQATRITLTLLAFAGAVSLPLYYLTAHRGWRTLAGDLQLRALLIAGLGVTLGLILLMLWDGRLPLDSILEHAPLLAFAAQTTTGFSSLPPEQLDPASKLLLILSMATGGGLGSTAGGIKLLRVLILLRLLQLLILRSRLPGHAVVEPRLGGQRLEAADLERTLTLILLFIFVVLASWLPFLALGYNPLDALFEVVSATGTVGLSTGISRTALEPLLKTVLCADMLMGRVEIVALLVLLYPGTWFGKRTT